MKPLSLLSFGTMAIVLTLAAQPAAAKTTVIHVEASHFQPGTHMSTSDDANQINFVIDPRTPVPFNQSAVKQSTAPAKLGPNPKIPYFTVNFALPIPPENRKSETAKLTGIDPMVFTHNHSPGLTILPNGDTLAIYFSTPPGQSEAAPSTSFVQARLRYGSVEWDMPELFFKTQGYNDQSGLLWNDNGKIWFFGGGRDISDDVPFRMATSTDNGATWTFAIPQLEKPASSYTAQPITNAFRGPDNAIYMAMDGHGSHSFLWRSRDDGVHWHDMGGRTGGRHSTIVPLDNKGNLLSLGGKNANVDGWSPESKSTDWGASWSQSKPSPFPPLGSGQRPSMIRLASGHLLFVTDSYQIKHRIPAPAGWKYGDHVVIAISTDNDATWRIKPLPVELPKHGMSDHATLGYVTTRQGPNGVIHILTTETQPCLQYELNEAWILSDAGDVMPETSGGTVKSYSEKYPNGKLRAEWSARICPNGRYLLDGRETDYYENGQHEHVVTYANGRKTGEEMFWTSDGTKLWSWQHDLPHNHAVWTHYWSNGQKKVESNWDTKPVAPHSTRAFFGYVADGPARQWDEHGKLIATHRFVNGLLADSGK